MALVGLVLLAWAVPRLAALVRRQPGLASCLVLASPLMIANGVAGLHNDLLMVGLMAAALVVAARARLGGRCRRSAGSRRGSRLPGGLVCVAIVLVTAAGRRPALAVPAAPQPAGVAAVSVAALVVPGVVIGPRHRLGRRPRRARAP